ncbi:MAG: hypothetical protein VYA80_06015 [Pseudomonadota bacterium]|nr:hypothetical protein [Pseudomonadota bacterium]
MLLTNRFISTALANVFFLLGSTSILAQETALPDPESNRFCSIVQKILSNTSIESINTIFDNMPDYRSSKPSVSPLNTYQVITYSGATPIVVSCKIKTSDHLQSEYGEDAAGKQRYCPEISKLTLQQAITELETENADAAVIAANFVVDDTEPYATGQSYLGDYQPIAEDDTGTIHITSPGLQSNWNNFPISWILPDELLGQTYCHFPTVDFLKAVATGEIEPGLTVTTSEDAPTQPN